MTNLKKNVTKPPFINPLTNMLGYHLRRASNAMLTELCRDYSTLGLGLTEATILILINSNSGLKQSDLGRALDIKSGNMTPLITALNKRGYVDRKPLDGRSHGLYLSNGGQLIVEKVLLFVDKNEQWLSSEMSKLQREQVIARLGKIWD